jgi:hypothetical protein
MMARKLSTYVDNSVGNSSTYEPAQAKFHPRGRSSLPMNSIAHSGLSRIGDTSLKDAHLFCEEEKAVSIGYLLRLGRRHHKFQV